MKKRIRENEESAHLAKFNKKEKSMLKFVISITIILISLLIGVYMVIRQLDRSHDNIKQYIIEINDNEFDVAVNLFSKYATTSTNKIARGIESSIKKKYAGKMDELKEEFENNNYSVISDILASFVEDRFFNEVYTDGNRMFVANYDGVLCDFSKYTLSGDTIYEVDQFRDWNTIIENSYNKESCREAINKILKNSTSKEGKSDVIIWQYTDPDDPSIKVDGDITVTALRDIYIEHGLDGLKSFELLIPSYITDTGDIFGQTDIDAGGVVHKTYKLMAVQRINIYDQLIQIFPGIDKHNLGTLSAVNAEHDVIIYYVYLIAFILSVAIVATIIHFCYMFNRLLDNSRSGEYKADADNES